jgi:hypothetical protein
MHGYVYAQFLADNPREFGVVEGITDMAQVKT